MLMKKVESQDELEHSDEPCTNVEINKFNLRAKSYRDQTIGDSTSKEKNGDVNKEVQTETVYHEHDCFYFDETLKSREEVNTHVKTFHGRPWTNFTCEQYGLEFEDISDLKAL